MELEKKLKVALVCHFSNPTVREHLPLSKRRLYIIGRRLLGLPSKSARYGDVAMHYELPVICYKTEGTPKLNQDKECVLIAENANVEDLAAKMIQLLSDQEKEVELRQNAKDFSRRWNNDEGILRQMVDNFYTVVGNYRYGIPVPEHLLYKEDAIKK